MNASELIYNNKIEKRVLLISNSIALSRELEGILTQIQMPEVVRSMGQNQFSIDAIGQYDPHLILLDETTAAWQDKLSLLRYRNTEVPIILLTDQAHTDQEAQLILDGVHRFISKDTLRFCGQILYRCIHGFSLQKYYQVESTSKERIATSIAGLKDIQSFWDESSEIQDPTCKKVLKEIEATLSYLDVIQRKLTLRELS